MGKPNSAAVCMAFHRGGPHTVGMGVYVGGGVASVSGAARTNGTGTGAWGGADAGALYTTLRPQLHILYLNRPLNIQ